MVPDQVGVVGLICALGAAVDKLAMYGVRVVFQQLFVTEAFAALLTPVK